MGRTVQITVDLSKMTHGNVEEFNKAIGYLAMWGYSTYTNVKIMNDRDSDILAMYEANGAVRFVMGAIWRKEEGKYTFHS